MGMVVVMVMVVVDMDMVAAARLNLTRRFAASVGAFCGVLAVFCQLAFICALAAKNRKEDPVHWCVMQKRDTVVLED